jgi:PhnB protein
MSDKKVKAIPEGLENVIPYLVCRDTEKVIEFCQKAFDAKLTDMNKSEDGYVMHATIQIRNSAIMLSEASEKYPPMPVMLYIYFDDVDAVYKKAVEAGGISLREPTDEFYGDRSCGVKDVSGNQWWMASHVEDVSAEEMAERQKKK